jgi:hypothetical protein
VKDITKNYALLTNDERFRLFVEAIGRKDLQDADRLDNSCPRKTYKMPDWDYTRKKVRFVFLAQCHLAELFKFDALAHLALVVQLAHEGEDDGLESAEAAADVFKKLISVRAAKQAAWERFCDLLGVKPSAIANQLQPQPDDLVGFAESIAEELGVGGFDEDLARRQLSALLDVWQG